MSAEVNASGYSKVQLVTVFPDLIELRDGESRFYQISYKNYSGVEKTKTYEVKARNGRFDLNLFNNFFRHSGNCSSPRFQGIVFRGLSYEVVEAIQNVMNLLSTTSSSQEARILERSVTAYFFVYLSTAYMLQGERTNECRSHF